MKRRSFLAILISVPVILRQWFHVKNAPKPIVASGNNNCTYPFINLKTKQVEFSESLEGACSESTICLGKIPRKEFNIVFDAITVYTPERNYKIVNVSKNNWKAEEV